MKDLHHLNQHVYTLNLMFKTLMRTLCKRYYQ